MNLWKNFLVFLMLCFILNISLSNQSKSSHKESKNKRKIEDSSSEYQPIRILIDTSILDQKNPEMPKDNIYWALNNCSQILSELLSVIRVTEENPIKYNFTSHPEFNISQNIVNGSLSKGNFDYDLILIVTLDWRIQNINYTILSRDDKTKRPNLGILNLAYSNEMVGIRNIEVIYLQYLFLHYLIHFLGFSYENFSNFTKNGNKIDVYETKFDDRMKLNTNYIKTPKVLEIAKKYYNCQNITGIPLENQEGNTTAHWDARWLLGDIMNSYNYNYKSDQVISEFTLALLEDSGWYKVNYYTGGLMSFGKNKGCEFIYNDCSTSFKNEFCEYFTDNTLYGSCSSGRQARTYCSSNFYNNYNIPDFYRRYPYRSVKEVDYCIINEPYYNEALSSLFVGSCKHVEEQINYGTILNFQGKRRSEITTELVETFSNTSFCVLVSLIPSSSSNNEENLLNIIHPICYEMFCSDTALTIKIKNQFIVCPREGGKVRILGDFQGYIYCPDYNLICSGSVLCNDMFDCVRQNSSIKESSYSYDYKIATSQIQSELKNDVVIKGCETSNNGKCIMNCSQCYQNGTCIECGEDYYFVGDFPGVNRNQIKCLKINISSGYFPVEGIYYPCLSNCDKCTNNTLCEKCMPNYYFIQYNRTYCDSGKDLQKYYTTDGGFSYFPCDSYFENCEFCENKDNCTKCKDNYYFIGEKKEKCEELLDKTNYFTEDGGISYLLCSNYITNCQSCNSRNQCTQCDQDYYMIGDNRANCVKDVIKNFDEYYKENEEGPVYYLCNTSFENCLTCTDKNTCTNCQQGFVFLRGEKKECFFFDQNKIYEDNGFYYPCYDAFPFCDKCKGKGSCYECFSEYYLILNENNRPICDKIDVSKYYKRNDDIYILCSNEIDNCDECQSDKICNKCKNNYYILANNYDTCRNDLDLRKYYSENNNISFFPCSEAMNQCDFCNNKSVCEKCNDNYYLYKEKLNQCINLDDIEKYYKKGISYYPCNESIHRCEKCFDSETCYQCQNDLKLILGEQNKCYEENILSLNTSLVKINETFYMKCSEKIEHCQICKLEEGDNDNDIFCSKCENNYFFVNENKKECINSLNITPLDEFVKINNTDYYTCYYKGVEYCQKCKNLTMCDLCSNDYAFVDFNYSLCHKKSDMQKGFYHDYNEFMYFHCLKHCDVCTNGRECIQCQDNFTSFKDNTYCDICELNVTYLYNNLTQELIHELVIEYFDQNENSYGAVNLYLNNESNSYSIAIFKASKCTELIFDQNEFMEFNLDELNNKINYNLFEDFSFAIVNYNYKNILQIYAINAEGITQINFEDICPECLELNYLKIKNNFGSELNNKFGPVLFDEIIENDYNIFDKEESIFNDICNNFNLKNIDIPLRERRSLLYLGNMEKEILCNDINCDVKYIILANTTSFCDCGINTDLEFLLSSEDNDRINGNNKEEYDNFIEQKKTINSFVLFKCAKEAFNSKNIKNNVGFYISLALFVIQLALFIIYITCKNLKQTKAKAKKKIKSNPPKLGKVESFSISEDLEDEKEDIKENGDNINKIKLKEIKSFNEKKKFGENILDDDDEEEGDYSQNIQDKDIDSAREREIKNEIIDSGGEINEENFKIQENNYKMNRNGPNLGKVVLNKAINKTNNKNKFNFIEENSFEGDEGINEEENKKVKYRNNKLYRTKKLYSIGSKESLNHSDIKEIQNDIYQKTEYVKFNDAIKKKEISFYKYYFKLIQLKQPLINLFSPIKCLKLEENNIPTLIKIMRIIFMLALNFFFNILHLEQKYFRKKFEHFNKKYNIVYQRINNISSNEIFEYAMGHTVISGFISFIICLIIQSVINIFIFNLRKKLNLITSRKSHNKENESEKIHYIFLALKDARKCYIVFFSVCLGIMVVIFYLLINFNEVYHGGILDLIAAVIWTFIFLQIVPFIYCIIFALIRYLGIKNRNEKMYYFSQIIFF